MDGYVKPEQPSKRRKFSLSEHSSMAGLDINWGDPGFAISAKGLSDQTDLTPVAFESAAPPCYARGSKGG
jgi:hypothetical protein